MLHHGSREEVESQSRVPRIKTRMDISAPSNGGAGATKGSPNQHTTTPGADNVIAADAYRAAPSPNQLGP